MPNPLTSTDSITGVLERIIYFNEENHFCIGEFRSDSTSQTITITGQLPSVQCGETLLLNGHYTNHPVHGDQFKINSFESKLPSSIHGIRKYLGSGLVPGVGKVYANKIVDAFKESTLKVISEESARLREVPGIGIQRAKSIKAAWDSQQAFREVFVFLKTYGVTTAQCLRLVKEYGAQAIEVLKNEPYRMARDMRGIGFKTADKIALNLGLPNDGPARLDAGILYVIEELASEGHTAADHQLLKDRSTELLETDSDNIEARIHALIKTKDLVHLQESNQLQSPLLHQAEKNISETLNLCHSTPSQLPSIILDKAVHWAQARAGFEFAPEQARAIECALSSKISVITGGPGTGKTTILRALVDILKAKKLTVTLAAPTGRAAKRLSQASRHYAQTIHRLLKFDTALNSFTHRESNPLKTDFIIIDEASMLDTLLARALFRAIPAHAHILLVGDVHQLPSIGPGSILDDIIKSPKFRTIALNKIFRQKDCSNIVTTAHAILEGNAGAPFVVDNLSDLEKHIDLQFIKAPDAQSCIQNVIDLHTHYIPQNSNYDPLMDVQVLAPMHKGDAGISAFNKQLQSALNKNSQSISLGSLRFQVSDKVIQTRNNYDKNIFNGDLGKILSINSETSTMLVNFDGHEVELERSELPDLTLAYAISIHKSQGSEFPIVIIPLLKQHFIMLKRNLLYTAITRGRKKVYIVGDPVAYAMAVNNKQSNTRCTDLLNKINTST